MLADFDADRGEETATNINSNGGTAAFTRCDVSNEHDVHALVQRTLAVFGQLDFAHNNAGVSGVNARLADQTSDTWNRVVGVNLTGAFLCMRDELAIMAKQGSGVIINTASNAGFRGFENLAPYVATKHGVIGMTKSAAVEYGPVGIRVTAICPGATQSPMLAAVLARNPAIEGQMLSRVPLGRFGAATDIADAVVWLCSESASYITGTTLLVDGGNTAG
jgi:NAD(P)-dependent dehydrogenase (short-subunit alcohol dehydrogenase family)